MAHFGKQLGDTITYFFTSQEGAQPKKPTGHIQALPVVSHAQEVHVIYLEQQLIHSFFVDSHGGYFESHGVYFVGEAWKHTLTFFTSPSFSPEQNR